MIKKMITAFPFYNKIEMQNRFRENSILNVPYALIFPENRFIPFQFAVENKTLGISKIFLCVDEFNKTDISENKALIQKIEKESANYFQYLGAEIMLFGKPIKMDERKRWIEIEFTNGESIYSEVFSAKNFKEQKGCRYLKIEYKSKSDLYPILYSSGFKQEIYLDTYIHINEPEIEEEVKENNKGQTIPLSQKMLANHKIVDLLPDFAKLAVSSLQMHDDIKITTPFLREVIEVDRVTVTSTPTADGAFSTVDISVRQILLSLNACNSEII